MTQWMIAWTILIISLSSCKNKCIDDDIELKEPQEVIELQCKNAFVLDQSGLVDPVNSECHCREFKYSADYIGVVNPGNTKRYPLEKCHELIGYSPDSYKSVRFFWFEAIENYKEAKKRVLESELSKVKVRQF